MPDHYTYSMWSSQCDIFTVTSVSRVFEYEQAERRVTIIAVDIESDEHFVAGLLNHLCRHDSVFFTDIGVDCPVSILRHVLWSYSQRIGQNALTIDAVPICVSLLISYGLRTRPLNNSLYTMCSLIINDKAPLFVLDAYRVFDCRIARVLDEHTLVSQEERFQVLSEVKHDNA